MPQWLKNQLTDINPAQPKGYFAKRGVQTWPSATATIIRDNVNIDADIRCLDVASHKLKDPRIQMIRSYEHIYLAYQNYSAIAARNVCGGAPYDMSRALYSTFYYSIYCASIAMNWTSDLLVKEPNHSQVANMWAQNFGKPKRSIAPFSYAFTSMIPKKQKELLSNYLSGNSFNSNDVLALSRLTPEQAKGSYFSFLNGTAEQSVIKKLSKKDLDKILAKHNAKTFNNKEAAKERDASLGNGFVGFPHVAYRFRRKAHYRDALYLGYENKDEAKMNQFLEDLELISYTYIRMASYHLKARFGEDDWLSFLEDLEENNNLSTPISVFKI